MPPGNLRLHVEFTRPCEVISAARSTQSEEAIPPSTRLRRRGRDRGGARRGGLSFPPRWRSAGDAQSGHANQGPARAWPLRTSTPLGRTKRLRRGAALEADLRSHESLRFPRRMDAFGLPFSPGQRLKDSRRSPRRPSYRPRTLRRALVGVDLQAANLSNRLQSISSGPALVAVRSPCREHCRAGGPATDPSRRRIPRPSQSTPGRRAPMTRTGSSMGRRRR